MHFLPCAFVSVKKLALCVQGPKLRLASRQRRLEFPFGPEISRDCPPPRCRQIFVQKKKNNHGIQFEVFVFGITATPRRQTCRASQGDAYGPSVHRAAVQFALPGGVSAACLPLASTLLNTHSVSHSFSTTSSLWSDLRRCSPQPAMTIENSPAINCYALSSRHRTAACSRPFQ